MTLTKNQIIEHLRKLQDNINDLHSKDEINEDIESAYQLMYEVIEKLEETNEKV